MPLTVGTRLGPYEILSPLGAGGMGEVYKGRDMRLDRLVAIKVSKEKFSERFEREARSIAALNHPHICTLHDVGPNYLVMEYIEGLSLKGPLALDQALKYADQICDALDTAHKKGITHRDLKPANILVTKQGIKLLDFGLARMASGAGDDTVTMAVMGTPAYMAPEQWEGKPGDGRSDIYAFGCVLYEMLTGKRPVQDRGVADPAALEQIIKRCLEKDPDDRWQSARDLGHALEFVGPTASLLRPLNSRFYWAAWVVAAVSLAIALALFLLLPRSAVPTAAEVVRLSLNPPENTSFTGATIATVPVPQFAVSPDGKSIAFAAGGSGAKPTLWLRSLQEDVGRAMPGTEGADFPFWSPDSRWIGFFADNKLKKIPATGGPAQAFADAQDPRGGSWGPGDTVLFGTGAEGVFRVSASGGTVVRVTERDVARHEGSHRNPEFLPDGKHFLFTLRSGQTDQTGVFVGSLDGKTKKLILRGNTNASYSTSGHLLFMNGDTLMAQAFDAESLELHGQAFIVESQVGLSSVPEGAFSVSGSRVLAHSKTLSDVGRLTWFDRGGSPSGTVNPPGDYVTFQLSPDQTRLAASLVDLKTGTPDIWLTDVALGNPTPFTFAGFFNAEPIWSPDGARIAFRSFRSGAFAEFYTKSAGGGGQEEPVLLEQDARALEVSPSIIPWDWSPDGRYLLYTALGRSSGLWLMPLIGERKPVKFLSAPGEQLHANFSPDGRLVAYSSSESGRFEVHIQTLPLSDRQWVVSTAGGSMPRWRADGRELYYLSPDWKLMAVPVGSGTSFGSPRLLFQTHVPRTTNLYRTHYVPSRDGQRFLVNTLASDPPPVPITIVLNWTAGLKK
jgi:Tol biopolymer transport system component/predicted Ser/Thr protein kinase